MLLDDQINVIILAAGKGTRMKSDTLKVLHHVAGKPILSYVLDAVQSCAKNRYVVIGHQADAVRSTFSDPSLTFVEQTEQLGTGHAVQQVMPYLTKSSAENTLILAGDCPLIQPSTLTSLLQTHQDTQASATVLTTHMKDPYGYGRILRSENNQLLGIREQKDCNSQQATITEINSGIYIFNTALLQNYISTLQSNNNQKEYYLTDIIHILNDNDKLVSAMITDDPNEIIGVNTRQDLAKINAIIYDKINHHLMTQGVTIVDPKSTFIDASVTIGHDSIIHPFSILTGTTSIGNHCIIGPYVNLNNEIISDNDIIKNPIFSQTRSL
tara:strand:- start:7691 stop:8668 length:978 start_codon:yes stop_codon:yes gene_type:complete